MHFSALPLRSSSLRQQPLAPDDPLAGQRVDDDDDGGASIQKPEQR